MSNKKKIKIVRLISTKTKHFYTIKKNNKFKLKIFELKKFDPLFRKHVLYKESKKKIYK